MHAQLTALQQAQTAGTPPPLPDALTMDSVAALLTHPYLADEDKLYARLLHVALPLVTVDNQLELLLQESYSELCGRVHASLEASSAPAGSRPATPRRRADDHLYTSAAGNQYDTRERPPYPCNKCNTYHWRVTTPCPSNTTQGFSRRGASGPAPAPRSSQAGPTAKQ